jgi:hypothetical protein
MFLPHSDDEDGDDVVSNSRDRALKIAGVCLMFAIFFADPTFCAGTSHLRQFGLEDKQSACVLASTWYNDSDEQSDSDAD